MRTLEIEVGGINFEALLQRLEDAKISLNEFAERLLMSDTFSIRPTKEKVSLVEMTVAELGLEKGGSLTAIVEAAKQFHLLPCEIDIAPFLRLQFFPQANSHGLTSTHQAPDASVTVASKPVSESDDFPKGFYLRKVDDVLWLRGYICDDQHIFQPGDTFIFKTENTTKSRKDEHYAKVF